MPIRYQVEAGDCIASIAFRHGFWPATLWEHPENRELRMRRRSPSTLVPKEDEVFIPDRREKSEVVATGRRHVFRRRGVPEQLVVRLLNRSGEPRSDRPYRMVLEDGVFEGKTDAEGVLRLAISPATRRATLVMDGSELVLELGSLWPLSTPEGLARRLFNLGYLPSSVPETEALAPALRAFQQEYSLPETGEADSVTLEKLQEQHGS